MPTIARGYPSAIPLQEGRLPGFDAAAEKKGDPVGSSIRADIHGNKPGSRPRKSRFSVTILAGLAGFALSPAEAEAADPVARDIASTAGLVYNGLTDGESPVFDYDKDGDRDILLNAHYQAPWRLMQNQGDGRFKEVLQGTFPKRDRHSCIANDFGRVGGTGRPDGLLDVYCTVGACMGQCTGEHPNELFLQRPDHTFMEVARAWSVADVHGRGREPLALDYNRDGLLDLVVTNEAPSIYETPNRLFKNVGGKFQEVTGSVIRRESASVCVEAADINGDGWTDLLLCSHSNSGIGVLTYRNASGTFQDITASTPYRGVGARQIELADVNRDGRPDLLIVEEKLFSIRLNVGGAYPKVHYSYPLNRGSDLAVADVSLDNWPDIYISQTFNADYPDIMLINNRNGVSYHTMPLPRVLAGHGNVVTAIPNWRGWGRAAFLVTNGKWTTPGPTQLILFSTR